MFTKINDVLHKMVFIFGHTYYDKNFYFLYKKLKKSEWEPRKELIKKQEQQLQNIIKYAYQNVPYYNKIFKKLKLKPRNIKKIEDLEKLPIITKDIINNNYEDFKPKKLESMKYFSKATGGTTGSPLKYRVLNYDQILSAALLYRDWGFAGYKLGDSMILMGGYSIMPNFKFEFMKKINEYARNVRMLSSFEMGKKEMAKFVQTINKFKPKYMMGYASSINEFSEYLIENKIKIHPPKAIFPTSEKLFPHMRKTIEKAFQTKVFDGYGLNEGGVSTVECKKHTGLHIDTERSIVEFVDNKNKQIKRGEGKIISTNLYNYAMPLIRYETGDYGKLSDKFCNCGRQTQKILEISGRSTDILLTPEGKKVHGWFFLYTFWKHCTGIKQYQVIQNKIDEINIKIIKSKDYDETQTKIIRDIVKNKSPKWKLKIEFVKKIPQTKAGKHKFIINNIKNIKK